MFGRFSVKPRDVEGLGVHESAGEVLPIDGADLPIDPEVLRVDGAVLPIDPEVIRVDPAARLIDDSA